MCFGPFIVQRLPPPTKFFCLKGYVIRIQNQLVFPTLSLSLWFNIWGLLSGRRDSINLVTGNERKRMYKVVICY